MKGIHLTKDYFKDFFESEKSGGLILIFCTVVSLIIANSAWAEAYHHFWQMPVDLSFSTLALRYPVELWINDGLMAIFFLLVGLEIEREIYVGELSTLRKAVLPVVAAIGGMLVPAGIHLLFNAGTPTQPGFGIPMATDIAFALGILSLVGNRIPLSLKIFLTALAVIDDLGAIIVIAIFYTQQLATGYLLAAAGIFAVLLIMNRLKVNYLAAYLIPGVALWYCILQSGIHATISGVLLAFAIPFNDREDHGNISYKLQHHLHKPVAFVILPLFALANTAITLPRDLGAAFTSSNAIGIMAGLLLGKCIGISGFTWGLVKSGVGILPSDITPRMLFGMALLGGIGFTMSIFIANLAFTDAVIITASKLSILTASVLAAVAGYTVLKRV